MASALRLVLLVIAMVVTSAAARADDVGDVYKGKTLTIVVGYPPASGYTFYGQMLARTFGDHIPGHPTVVVQSMPGAGSIKAANYLYNVAPKDGTVIGMFSIGALIDELLGQSSTSFEAAKFGWIGNMDESVGLCVVTDKSGVSRFDDLRKTETLFGGTGASGGATQAALALSRLFGAKIKLIKGYPGAEDVVLAMERGEVQGVCGLTKTVLKSRLMDAVASGRLKPILHDNMKPQADLPGVPSVYDLARNEDDRAVLDLLFGWRVLGRPVAAPPGLPAERLQMLRQAFAATMADPKFIADAQKANLDLAPASGADVDRLVRRLFSHPPDVIKRAAEAVRSQ